MKYADSIPDESERAELSALAEAPLEEIRTGSATDLNKTNRLILPMQ